MKKILIIMLLPCFVSAFAQKISRQEVGRVINELHITRVISDGTRTKLLEKLSNQETQNLILSRDTFFLAATIWQKYFNFDLKMKEALDIQSKSLSDSSIKSFDEKIDSALVSNEKENTDWLNSLGFWADEVDKKLIGKYLSGSWVIYPPLKPGIPKEKKKEIMAQLNLLVKKKIISDIEKTKALEYMEQFYFIDEEMFVLQNVMWAINFFVNYETLKQEQIDVLDSLKKENKLSEKNYKKLIDSYKPFEIKKESEIISLLNNIIVIDNKELSLKPNILYPGLLEKMKKILPEFDYKDLKIEQISETFRTPDKLILITLSVREVVYKLRFRHHKKIKYTYTFYNFVEMVNKFLNDRDDKNRWMIQSLELNTVDAYKIALILTDKWLNEGRDLNPSFNFEKRRDVLGTLKIKQKIEELKQLGFFNHLSSGQISKGTETALEEQIHNYSELLERFDGVFLGIKDVDYDVDSLGNITFKTEVYKDFILQLSQLSKNQFSPVQISDTHTEYMKNKTNSFKIKWTLSGEIFENEFLKDDYPLIPKYEEIVEFTNKCLIAVGSQNQFHLLDYFRIIFLTPAQYQFLKEKEPELFIKK